MPKTLLTGANSFVGAHIIDNLIRKGHDVTGTVRREGVGDEIYAFHPEWKSNLDIVVISDYTDEASWDELFQKSEFDHIVHVAAPLLDNPANTDYDEHFLKPSVEGNLAILRSAKKYAPTVKSIAVTGSINAVTTGSKDEILAGPFTNSSWLQLTQEDARAAQNAYYWYCSGKKEGELAIWNFIETEKPSFTVTVFLPALIFGPPIEPIKDAKHLHYSSRVIYSFFDGSNATVPATTFPSYIDVRDLAEAHVRSLTIEGAKNKRFLIGGMPMTYTDLVRSLAKVPQLEGRLPAESGENADVALPRIEAKEGNEILDMKFRTLDETMKDAAERILELEKLN